MTHEVPDLRAITRKHYLLDTIVAATYVERYRVSRKVLWATQQMCSTVRHQRNHIVLPQRDRLAPAVHWYTPATVDPLRW